MPGCGTREGTVDRGSWGPHFPPSQQPWPPAQGHSPVPPPRDLTAWGAFSPFPGEEPEAQRRRRTHLATCLRVLFPTRRGCPDSAPYPSTQEHHPEGEDYRLGLGASPLPHVCPKRIPKARTGEQAGPHACGAATVREAGGKAQLKSPSPGLASASWRRVSELGGPWHLLPFTGGGPHLNPHHPGAHPSLPTDNGLASFCRRAALTQTLKASGP